MRTLIDALTVAAVILLFVIPLVEDAKEQRAIRARLKAENNWPPRRKPKPWEYL